jgi:hypothetical protein
VSQFKIRKYTSYDYLTWNNFINQAKNATFLFHRDFMEYHQDRFEDHSLIVEDEKGWMAVLPANKVDNVLYSHQGLTYGGLVLKETVKLEKVILIFKTLLQELHINGFNSLFIKELPFIYSSSFSDDWKYCMFLLDAKLLRRDTLSVIDLGNEIKLTSGRKEGVKRGVKNELTIKEEGFSAFWNSILIPNLQEKHQTKPVHSLSEIELLKSRFPSQIRQFNVYKNQELVGGTTIFESKKVAHAQYISANSFKNEYGTLDFLHHHLITKVFQQKCYLDFGVSNENGGHNLNGGLSYWKESFGAHTVTQDFYEVEVDKYTNLEGIIL